MKIYIVFFLGIVAVCMSCKKENTTPLVQINDMATNINDTVGKGSFISYEHGLQGNAILYKEIDGTFTLRFEKYNMSAGPDVYVFLSTSNTYSPGKVIQVAKLSTGYSNSNINFPFSDGAYTKDHVYVLVYCKQFTSLFGYTLLK